MASTATTCIDAALPAAAYCENHGGMAIWVSERSLDGHRAQLQDRVADY